MKVSVIVPCYNVEDYVAKCLDSLVSQTLKDIEIICVNDGSRDNTKKIIDKYARKHKNIIVIDKKNGGLSSARNAGMEKATGEYIGFVDSDDFVETDMFEKLYNKAKEKDFDLVTSDVRLVYPDMEKIVSSGVSDDTFDKEKIKEYMIFSYVTVWNKLYKKDVIKDVRFKEGVCYEDVHFNYRVFPMISSLGVVHEAFVNYIQREDSITYTFNEKLYDFITVMNDLVVYYKENNLYDEYYIYLEYAYVKYAYNTFVKRLAKCGDFNKYMDGVNYAKREVKKHFPKYRCNSLILKPRSVKGLFNSIYFIFFNKLFAAIIFKVNQGKMN